MPGVSLAVNNYTLDYLKEIVSIHNPDSNIKLLEKAYYFAEASHGDQRRLSGEPYILHPLTVAIILAQLRMDTETVIAGLLHDVAEDTDKTIDDIEKEYNKDIAFLVDGVTKINSSDIESKNIAEAKTLRKILFATTKDIRIIVIKLADRLHNMRTIQYHKVENQKKIAYESLYFYTPIARRLGMRLIASEIDDLSFQVLFANDYSKIKNKVSQNQRFIDKYMEKITRELDAKLKENSIEARIVGRSKHYFSIFRKMQRSGKNYSELINTNALRVITKNKKDCYTVLGIIHELWKPSPPDHIRDYIAVEKSNKYQSLHTKVLAYGFPLKFQIRTQQMHETAELGVCVHWLNNEGREKQKEHFKDIDFIRNLENWNDEEVNISDFKSNLEMDLYDKEIYIFTPKSKIITLAKGATPIDFAFAVHTKIGYTTVEALVNDKKAYLNTALSSGDKVEIITDENAIPCKDWLSFVRTSKAKHNIEKWYKKNEKEIIETEKNNSNQLPQKGRPLSTKVTISEMYNKKIVNILGKKRAAAFVDSENNVLVRIAQCCKPIPGDDVVGFITGGRGISLHKINCPSLEKNECIDNEKFIELIWTEKRAPEYPVKIQVEADERVGLLNNITECLISCGITILKSQTNVITNQVELTALLMFVIPVSGQKQLFEIIRKIESVPAVKRVYKI